MTFYVDSEVDLFGGESALFDLYEVTQSVLNAVMEAEKCPYEAEVNIVICDDENIRKVNRESRGVDEVTDVLSFPSVEYKEAANFSEATAEVTNFEPDSGNLLLGDIIISAERVRSQAEKYEHGLKREYAFLLTHSLLHLIGYDHKSFEEEEIMELKQENILKGLGIGSYV